MATTLKLFRLQSMGVNVDSDPISMDDSELRQAQNAIRDPMEFDGLRKRPGLGTFSTSPASGPVLGGLTIPQPDLSTNGIVYIFIGRSSVT